MFSEINCKSGGEGFRHGQGEELGPLKQLGTVPEENQGAANSRKGMAAEWI